MRLFTPDADFIMKLNSLEQQLAHSQEDNKQLRRRIADGDRRLEAEQERNRQLKGA
jgi:septal ring factor EnvC (AmiA/AmiB activator)